MMRRVRTVTASLENLRVSVDACRRTHMQSEAQTPGHQLYVGGNGYAFSYSSRRVCMSMAMGRVDRLYTAKGPHTSFFFVLENHSLRNCTRKIKRLLRFQLLLSQNIYFI